MTALDPHLVQWLHLFLRWFHLTVGIAWIGASFYFNWLEGNLNRKKRTDETEGDLWAVHGGGFYHVTKYRVAPADLPDPLHWFKWEAYFTWISGFCLLAVVYYLGADSYLIDPAKLALTPISASALSMAILATVWVVYDCLCRSPLIRAPRLFAVTMFGLFTLLAYGLDRVFIDRAAYIHIGAAIGTIMVFNVFFVIIPNQRKTVAALITRQPPDPQWGAKALQRSLHNNYFTLPVLFVMVSNHFPITFGHAYNWLLLAALSAISLGARHYFNLKNRGHRVVWILPVSALAMVGLALVTRPPKPGPVAAGTPHFHHVQAIILNRCVQCHSATPTDDVWRNAPNGVMFDTKEQIKAHADTIKLRTVTTKTMPLANKTQITDTERALIGAWIDAGGP